MGDLLTALAAAQPDKTAIIDDRTGVTGTEDVRTCTFAEFEDRANQLVHVLDGLGVGPGDKVVWCGHSSTGILELTSASRKIGSTAVPLNYRLSDEEAAYVIDHCDATTVFIDVPGWLLDCEESTSTAGPVEMTFVPGDLDGDVRSGTMTYDLGGRSWRQDFRTEDVDDEKLADAAAEVHLVIDRTLTDDKRWLTLTAPAVGHT